MSQFTSVLTFSAVQVAVLTEMFTVEMTVGLAAGMPGAGGEERDAVPRAVVLPAV